MIRLCAALIALAVTVSTADARPRHHRHAHHHSRSTASLAGLPAPLVSMVHELGHACGMRLISTYRPGARVAGTGRHSLHGSHKAADVAGGSFKCAYAMLRKWPGGVSTDARRVRHIHLSWSPGGREWGARFAHGGGHRHVHHYARRHWDAPLPIARVDRMAG